MPVVAPLSLPHWTWWLPLPLFHLGTWLSLTTRVGDGVMLFYLPLVLGVVLGLWWGARVLPALYLNALLSAPLWGLPWQWGPVYAIPETVAVAGACWLLRRRGFDPALTSLHDLLRLLAIGVLLPSTLVAFGIPGLLRVFDFLPGEHWLAASTNIWLVDVTGLLALAPLLLAVGSPLLRARGLLAPSLSPQPPGYACSPGVVASAAILFAGLALLIGVLPSLLALPLLGISMLLLALRHAFAGALFGVVLALVCVLLPLVRDGLRYELLDMQSNQLQLAVLLLMGAVLVVGRVVGDLRQSLAASARVQDQLAQANLAMEASPLGITIADARKPDMPLVYCNPAFSRITGYSLQDVLGHNCRFLSRAEPGQPGLQVLRHALREGHAAHAVVRNYRKDGSAFWNEVALAPIRDAEGISHCLL